MPTYEYQCAKCGHFEVFQKMSEAPLTTCPQCGGPVQRLISGGAGLIFKGHGFYITDYKRNGNGGSNGSHGNGSKSTTKATTETKTATTEPSGGTNKAKE